MTRKRLFVTLFAAVATPALLTGALLATEKGRYLARQGLHQAELLWGAIPVQEAVAQSHFNEAQLKTLALVPAIKAYGASIGLAHSDNYSTIHPTWDRTIYNLSACDPVAFKPVTWWYPIVGSMPYIGFFRLEDAQARQELLEAQGHDVYLRTAGAYSTLGWFQDPLLPKMLDWTEHDLSNTLLHELAHATVWLPGSVQFNESFASFVGGRASMRFLAHTYGEDSGPVAAAHATVHDRKVYRELLHATYVELEAIYASDVPTQHKLSAKAAVLASLSLRARRAGFSQPERYIKATGSGTWNNARLMQFRTYNRSHEWFAALLDQEGGDLGAFMERVERITAGADDPYEALEAAVSDVP